jgi:hypothetical protein
MPRGSCAICSPKSIFLLARWSSAQEVAMSNRTPYFLRVDGGCAPAIHDGYVVVEPHAREQLASRGADQHAVCAKGQAGRGRLAARRLQRR